MYSYSTHSSSDWLKAFMKKTGECELRLDLIWCESESQFPLKTNVLFFTVLKNLIPYMDQTGGSNAVFS